MFVRFTFACSAIALTLVSPQVRAAPVTLAFEAEIVRVFDTVPFDAGVSFDLGDRVTGRFTFEPDEVGGGGIPGIPTAFESQQSGRAFITVNGVEFSTPEAATGITIQSFNDSFSTRFGILDNITVGSQLAPTPDDAAPNVESAGMALFLEGDADAMPGAIIPADPGVWNQLLNFDRRLRLTLRDGSDGSVGFVADLTPGSFAVIPEPTAWMLVSVPVLAVRFRQR